MTESDKIKVPWNYMGFFENCAKKEAVTQTSKVHLRSVTFSKNLKYLISESP